MVRRYPPSTLIRRAHAEYRWGAGARALGVARHVTSPHSRAKRCEIQRSQCWKLTTTRQVLGCCAHTGGPRLRT
eukprot:scaffold7251_cov132-Isochrysis_galbana.AAC.1